MKKKTVKAKKEKTVKEIRQNVAAIGMAIGCQVLKLSREPFTSEAMLVMNHNKKMKDVLAAIMVELAKAIE